MNKQYVISIQDEQTMTDDVYREPSVQLLSSDSCPHYSKQGSRRVDKFRLRMTVYNKHTM